MFLKLVHFDYLPDFSRVVLQVLNLFRSTFRPRIHYGFALSICPGRLITKINKITQKTKKNQFSYMCE